MNGPGGFEDGGLCMVLWASTNSLTGVDYAGSSDRYSKSICASCVYAPMASGGSDSQMAEEIVFQKSGAVKANG